MSRETVGVDRAKSVVMVMCDDVLTSVAALKRAAAKAGTTYDRLPMYCMKTRGSMSGDPGYGTN
jgi:hypothetical protein